MAAAVAAMADQVPDPRITRLESNVARLESDVAHIRTDIADIKVNMREMRKDISAMDKRITEVDKSLRAEMAGLRDDLTKGLASTRIWMLLQSAGLLAVMARAFKWI